MKEWATHGPAWTTWQVPWLLMRRLATWVLILQRWPSLVLAVFVLAQGLASSYWPLSVWVDPGRIGVSSHFEFGSVQLSAYTTADGPPEGEWCVVDWHETSVPPAFPRYYGWWEWDIGKHVTRGDGTVHVRLPAWCIVLSLAALSWTGFQVKRRMALPSGLCTRCRYPLAGVAICPECGTPA